MSRGKQPRPLDKVPNNNLVERFVYKKLAKGQAWKQPFIKESVKSHQFNKSIMNKNTTLYAIR